jgi:hypothetical protein
VLAQRVTGLAGSAIRVWQIALGDKAHAWNEYLRCIWPGSRVAFFIDGYAQVKPDALTSLASGLDATSEAWAATGVPTCGRSAGKLRHAMLTEGGIHGSLHAVRGDVLARMRDQGFRLPLGLYRTDGLVGAAICFSMNPAEQRWNSQRVLISPTAGWSYQPLRWWKPADLRTHVKRLLRQSQGLLENSAIKEHLAARRQAPESLPETTAELVEDWVRRNPALVRKCFLRHPLSYAALRRLRDPRDWSQAAIAPRLVGQKIAAD